MRLIVELLYLLIWVLIQIGDSVLFMGDKIKKSFRKRLFRSYARPRILKAKLKKNETLFKAKKKRKKRALLPLSGVFRKIFALFKRGIYRVKTKTLSTFLFILLKLKRAGKKVLEIRPPHLPRLPQVKFSIPRITFPKLSMPKIRTRSAKTNKKRSRKAKFTRPSIWYSLKIFIWGFIFATVFVFLPLLAIIFLSDLPNPSSISTTYIPKTTKIYDRNNNLLYEIFATQNRTVVQLNQIPKQLQQATIAIEDRDFYSHPGFDVRGITRAFFSNLERNDLQGGSTITQQLVKSSLLTPEPTITRKVKEVILAFWAERIYTKEQILELYFNYVPYGGTAWGIQAASDVYFGKPVSQLDLAESSFLAGLPRAPSVYSPYSGTGDLWKKRQKEVLSAMVKQKYITQKQADQAYGKKLNFIGPTVAIKAPHFVMYVKDELVKRYGLSQVERGGLQVKTSLDLSLQNKVQETVRTEVENDSHLNISNGASVVMDPRNGDILAMVGSRNYFDLEHDGNVNLVTALRQPGSTIKVVTYSLALSSGYTQASLVDDSPLTITPPGGQSYTPVNYDGKFRGRIPLRLAFANSLNIPAVRVAQAMGVENIVEQGKRMGITTWEDPSNYGLSITLGGADTTMLDLATVYSTVANAGKKVNPEPIMEVKDAQGNTIYKKEANESQVLDPGVAFIVSDILSDNRARAMEFGANSPLNIPGHRVSVKTGTTDNKKDNWTVGFTPNIVVATWVGNNDSSPMSQALASGITGAAPMWNKIMNIILQNRPEGPNLVPQNVVQKSCFGFNMYFLRGTENVSCSVPPSPKPTKPATALAN